MSLYISLCDKIVKITTTDLSLYERLCNKYKNSKSTRNFDIELIISSDSTYFAFQIGKLQFKIHKSESDFDLVNFTIKAILEAACVQFNIVCLHGASIRYRNQGYIFLGSSGSGKSTITFSNLRAGATVLSEDSTLVKKHTSEYRIYSSPFDYKVQYKMMPEGTVLRKVFKLQQHNITATTTMPLLLQLSELIHNDNFIMFTHGINVAPKGKYPAKVANVHSLQLPQTVINSFLFAMLQSVKMEHLSFTKKTSIKDILKIYES